MGTIPDRLIDIPQIKAVRPKGGMAIERQQAEGQCKNQHQPPNQSY
jgi:hypothetical protein